MCVVRRADSNEDMNAGFLLDEIKYNIFLMNFQNVIIESIVDSSQ